MKPTAPGFKWRKIQPDETTALATGWKWTKSDGATAPAEDWHAKRFSLKVQTKPNNSASRFVMPHVVKCRTNEAGRGY